MVVAGKEAKTHLCAESNKKEIEACFDDLDSIAYFLVRVDLVSVDEVEVSVFLCSAEFGCKVGRSAESVVFFVDIVGVMCNAV